MITVHKIAIVLAVAYLVVAIGWDVLLATRGQLYGNSFCAAFRELNQAADGLIALTLPGLYAHIFLLPLLPSWWRH
jgi:hypothetical protein